MLLLLLLLLILMRMLLLLLLDCSLPVIVFFKGNEGGCCHSLGCSVWSSKQPWQVKLSRWFDWFVKWKAYEPTWGFMKQVFKFWQVEKSKEDSVKKALEREHEQPAGEDVPGDAGQGDAAAGPVPDGDGEGGPPAAAAGPAADAAAPFAGARRVLAKKSSKDAHAELLRGLKQMQTQRHTLDILADVITDSRIKVYADAPLACC